MILVNGTVQSQINITDRGFQYGDGLFETIAVFKGKACFLNRHLKRLTQGCLRLKIPVPDLNNLQAEIAQLCQEADHAVLKIIVTRGSGGRGYRQPDSIQPTRVLSLHPFPSYPNEGITARFCQTRLSLNPTLAGLKHLNRLEQVLARSEWTDEVTEGIMLDINDRVIEGTMSNLFYIKNKQLYTAKLTQSGVAGIIRGLIMEHHAVIEHDYRQADLLAADECFICNAVIGIMPIKQLEQHTFNISKHSRDLQHWLYTLRHA